MKPAVLNASGRQIFRDMFPMFTQLTYEEQVTRQERLAEPGIAVNGEDEAALAVARELTENSVPVQVPRHRRFAGGDGMLPRGCYSALCHDAGGDDDHCLSRELFAYVDYRIPAFVYVGDSTSARLVEAVGAPIRARPGYCVICVLIAPPIDPERLPF